MSEAAMEDANETVGESAESLVVTFRIMCRNSSGLDGKS